MIVSTSARRKHSDETKQKIADARKIFWSTKSKQERLELMSAAHTARGIK